MLLRGTVSFVTCVKGAFPTGEIFWKAPIELQYSTYKVDFNRNGWIFLILKIIFDVVIILLLWLQVSAFLLFQLNSPIFFQMIKRKWRINDREGERVRGTRFVWFSSMHIHGSTDCGKSIYRSVILLIILSFRRRIPTKSLRLENPLEALLGFFLFTYYVFA